MKRARIGRPAELDDPDRADPSLMWCVPKWCFDGRDRRLVPEPSSLRIALGLVLRYVGLFFVGLAIGTAMLAILPRVAKAQASCTAVGTDRWAVKTLAPSPGAARPMSIAALVARAVPSLVKAGPRGVDAQPSRYAEEGALVTVAAWLQLVKTSPDDCDWHVQLTATPDPKSAMLIVEIPQPDGAHVRHDAGLRLELAAARDSLRVIKTAGLPRRVTVAGALFFDASHYPNCSSRGVGGMKAASCWELHPVVSVRRAAP